MNRFGTNVMAQDPRLEQAENWLRSLDVDLQSDLSDVAGDASFRRYFRVRIDDQSQILMDAPPPGENIGPFIDIARRLRVAGLHAPEIFHVNEEDGFLLLEDLGDELYRDLLDKNTVDEHFMPLLKVLKSLALKVNANGLPHYDADPLQKEMDLFPQWYLQHHRPLVLDRRFDALWHDFSHTIVASALVQPYCFVHRDYHSANLLKTAASTIGIIDFQDAVKGPLSYDFISLLWDRYISWPRQQLDVWMEEFRQMLGVDISTAQWQRDCDLMGLQRNFKIVGIFARLHYRDGKNGYLDMIPRFYRYLTDTLDRYPEFAGVLNILEQDSCVP